MNATEQQGEKTRLAIEQAMRGYEARYGLPATVEQIRSLARPGRPMSKGLVWYHLQRLMQQSRVTHTQGQCRTYRLSGTPLGATVPGFGPSVGEAPGCAPDHSMQVAGRPIPGKTPQPSASAPTGSTIPQQPSSRQGEQQGE